MTTTYHTPIAKGDPVDESIVNTPLAALDTQITAHAVSIAALEAELSDARGGMESLGDLLDAPIPNGTPASETATGGPGQMMWDTNYLYVCVATDTWKKITLENW